jgi:hypothetical protein
LPWWPLGTFAALAILAAPAAADERVARTKESLASGIDADLPRVPLERWLHRTIGSQGNLSWRISDCDLKPDPPEPVEGYPVCVAAIGRTRDRIGMKLHFLVATTKGNRIDPPRFQPQSLLSCSSSKGWSHGHQYEGIERLSELPAAIERLRESRQCR